jgi:(p)ppGpp synthase/HD superfamily hydrolase
MTQNLVARARAFALAAHKDTKYGKLPYEFHLRAVVAAMPTFASDEAVAAAWLHDAVEDTETTLHDIRQEFGGKVARLVDAVTDEPGPNRAVRKEGMYKKLAAAPAEARAVKLADRFANMKASIENPKKGAMYLKEFPSFMRKVAVDPENALIIVSLYELFMDALEASECE